MSVHGIYVGWVEERNPTGSGDHISEWDIDSYPSIEFSVLYHRWVSFLNPTYILLIALALLLPNVVAGQEEKKQLPPLHHLVKVKPPEGMKVAKNFPLNKRGEIDCQTCHGIKDIKDIPFDEVDKKADNFHRGGPYKQLTNFCYNCHKKEDYQRPNIHKLLDKKGEYDKKACEYCHKKAPDPKKEIVLEDLKFRLPPQKLCFGCHLKTPHLNAFAHQVKADEKMRERIKQAEQKQGVILPLDSDGKVMCATCHSPHEPGVISTTKPAGKQVADATLKEGVSYVEHDWNAIYSADKEIRLQALGKENGETYNLAYQRLKHEVLLRLPAKDGSLCQACHAF